MAKFNEMRAIWILLLVSIVISYLTPVFLSAPNLLNILLEVSVTGLLAIGQTYVIILAEIDLSVGAILGFSGAVSASVLAKGSLSEAILIAVAMGAAIGLINGLLVTKGHVPSFIATLGTMSAISGLTLLFTQGYPISITNGSYEWIGQGYFLMVPLPVWIMLILYAVFWYLLSRTRFGRYVYGTGGNIEACRLSGINVNRVKNMAFMLTGALSAVAGLILTARLSSAEPTAGSGMELDAIAAVILGGTSLAGGRGGVIGTIIGAVILGVLDNGMNLLNISAFYHDIVKGLIILLVVLVDKNLTDVSAVANLFRIRKGNKDR